MILIFTSKCDVLAINYNECNLIVIWLMTKLLYIIVVINYVEYE